MTKSDHPIAAGTPMAKAYAPEAFEERLYDWWESQGYFRPEVRSAGEPFVIPMPPPNVTGALHMGHALTASVEDLLVRHHRLRGRAALWIPGTDHAGIATQNVVEKALAADGLTRHDLGRDAFVERVWSWRTEYGGTITRQHRRLGVSADWSRERFTLDEGLSRAVREAFVRLFDQGLIVRDRYLVNWCPRCQTVISDIEVEHEDVEGTLYTFRYPLEAGGHIPVATTRPETILGDTAVAVHPEDERYRQLVGKTARVPGVDRAIPVIADAYVDTSFGTGALKITPAHDPNDYVIAQRHALDAVNIMEPDGRLGDAAGPYAGMDRLEARTRLWEDMRTTGLVIGEAGHVHSVGHCQRCHTVVEPLLSTQWFVRCRPLAEAAMAAVRDGRTRIVPERFHREYFHWLENIRDWVISRQLWWGHRIPVWYGPDGQAIAARNADEAAARAGALYGEAVALTQDEDVLDTWFSSALWPFSTLGWPDETEDLDRYYPGSVLETGYDILFFWVARMIMMGLAMTGETPFQVVYLHGLVRDGQGRKMSKSLGNAVDPLDVVATYGADALRFTLLTGSTPGQDIKLSDERLEGSRNFANKVWNIGRFVQSNLPEGFDPWSVEELESQWGDLAIEDRWILSRAASAAEEATRLIDQFQIGEAGRTLYEFAWSEFADWYVEAVKGRLYAGNPEIARQVLYRCMEMALTLLHPYMPFLTEAVWAHLPRRRDGPPALMIAEWPLPGRRDPEAEAAVRLLQELVRGIRNVRAEYGVEPGRRVPATVAAGELVAEVEAIRPLLVTLARLTDGAIGDAGEASVGTDREALVIARDPSPPEAAHATVVAGVGVQAWLPLAGLVDLGKERRRLEDEAAAATADVARLDGILANSDFVARAPAAVVDRERARLEEARLRLATVRGRLEQLNG